MAELPRGAHLVSQRNYAGLPVYTHHGIYIGDGLVIHYAGNSGDPNADGSKIQVVCLDSFHGGNRYWHVEHPNARFAPDEIVARARSRLAEDCYCVFANNCEHFCNWVIDDNHLSQQVDAGALAGGGLGAGAGAAFAGIAVPAGATALFNLYGGAAMMKGLATVGVIGGAAGGVALSGFAAGGIAAKVVNSTLLKENEAHSEDEAQARQIGRAASYAGAATAAAGSVAVISAAGVPGLSAAGITSGLAAIGGTVGGGMVAGAAMSVAAPAIVATGLGVGAYKIAHNKDAIAEKLASAGQIAGDAVAKGADLASQAIDKLTPVAAEAASTTTAIARSGLRALASAIETGAAAVKKKLDDGSA